jgi:hypothetical protein
LADLVVANSLDNYVPGHASILIGDGNGAFAPALRYAVGDHPLSIAVADLNGDEAADLVAADFDSDAVSVLLNRCNDSSLPCPEDLDGDGIVDVIDLLTILASWGPCPPRLRSCVGDITGDGMVDDDDLLSLVAAWGACP